jgi:hypothetical protein
MAKCSVHIPEQTILVDSDLLDGDQLAYWKEHFRSLILSDTTHGAFAQLTFTLNLTSDQARGGQQAGHAMCSPASQHTAEHRGKNGDGHETQRSWPELQRGQPRRMSMARRKSLRSQLYRAARDLGNVEAAEKGPGAYGKRVVRRKVYRSTNKVTGGFLRRLLG